MTRSGTALSALGLLLDRSLVQIAEASADARTYDRQTIHQVADVWDNNTLPLFHAAIALTSVGRERRARAALAWMAGLGPERRAWMVERAEAAGHPLERFLPPPVAEPPHIRDSLGLVMPAFRSLTAEAALELGTDYDLAAAEVRTLLLERAGTRLTGSLVLAAPRRYDTGPQAGEPPTLSLWLDDVTGVRFDSDDRMGVALHSGAEGTVIGVGASGKLSATSGTVYPDDRSWHLSTAGRAADQRAPPREERNHRAPERRRPYRQGAALVAGILHSVVVSSARSDSRTPPQHGSKESPHQRHSLRRSSRHGISACPPEGELRLATYTAAHTRHQAPQDPVAVIVLAHTEQDAPKRPWRLRALKVDGVSRFRLRADAFEGPHELRKVRETLGVESLKLGREALYVKAPQDVPAT
ncbi:hypothetical protein [Microbispora sp. NPDC049633]|uniref:hypothetical protein n=1 Tax=Microbispora sp. NPDC049633 TaxID=3154355 RepID=UPI0034218F4F